MRGRPAVRFSRSIKSQLLGPFRLLGSSLNRLFLEFDGLGEISRLGIGSRHHPVFLGALRDAQIKTALGMFERFRRIAKLVSGAG